MHHTLPPFKNKTHEMLSSQALLTLPLIWKIIKKTRTPEIQEIFVKTARSLSTLNYYNET